MVNLNAIGYSKWQESHELCSERNEWDGPWPTKYTAVYVTFEGWKLRGQFSENLVLTISL